LPPREADLGQRMAEALGGNRGQVVFKAEDRLGGLVGLALAELDAGELRADQGSRAALGGLSVR